MNCNIYYFQNKVTFHHHRADSAFSPVMLNGCTLALNICWDSNSLQTSRGTHVYNTSLKNLKNGCLCSIPENTMLLLPYSIFYKNHSFMSRRLPEEYGGAHLSAYQVQLLQVHRKLQVFSGWSCCSHRSLVAKKPSMPRPLIYNEVTCECRNEYRLGMNEERES